MNLIAALAALCPGWVAGVAVLFALAMVDLWLCGRALDRRLDDVTARDREL